ncbi:MAG TPA: glycosyltransferase family 1 protein [Anaerolineales bacterium]|nr:glycosyltransferase family 1 protein [Anaerolineales bacterium]
MNPSFTFILDARAAGPHFPGIGRYIRGLAGALPAQLRAQESLQFLVEPGPGSRFIPGEAVSIPAPASPFGIAQQRAIPPLLTDAAVYHSPYYLMPYRPGVPTVLTVYDLIPLHFPGAVSLRARLLFGLATRLAIRAADRIVAISESCRTDFLARYRGLEPEKINAISLAPDDRFRPQPAERIDRLRREYDLPAEFGLYLGINKPHKNLARLVEAWAGLDRDLPLVIAGAWDDRYPGPRRAAERLPPGLVRFLGPVPDDDLPALYSACRLFIFPSVYEGFGLPVVEALACGAAVACSNTSSLPEVGGDAVRYFDPLDSGSIRGTIAEALDAAPDPDASVRRASRFSWEATAAATLEIYRSLAYNHT